MKTIEMMERELLLKEERVSFWESHRYVPARKTLEEIEAPEWFIEDKLEVTI